MKQYMMIETRKRDAQTLMNNMAAEGWEVVTVTHWICWRISLLITFVRETDA